MKSYLIFVKLTKCYVYIHMKGLGRINTKILIKVLDILSISE